MTSETKRQMGFPRALVELCECLAAYFAVSRLFAGGPTDWMVATPASAITSWLAAMAMRGRGSGVSLWIDQFFYAAALTMLAQYGLVYAFGYWPAPILAIAAGAALSVGLMNLHTRRPSGRSGVLFLGFGSVAAALAPAFGRRITGVVDDDAERTPSGLAYLGRPEDLAEIVKKTSPESIVAEGAQTSSRALLELQYSGTPVVDGAALYETMLGRLRWDAVSPSGLLFSRRTNADRLGMAVQAVYTNVIGVGALVALAPILILSALAIAAFGRGGRILESTDCLGFQMIPFRLLRFGTRGRDGRPHAVGKALGVLHLASLPRLINVIRGEMAFFGPPPVRLEFAQRLTRAIPVYAHRFTVKPGILGWSQVSLGNCGETPDEALRLEYDLYYVKQNSVSLDLEILLRSLSPMRSAAPGEQAVTG